MIFLRVILFIKLFYVFPAYRNIPYLLHCQVMRSVGYVSLLSFFFHYIAY